MSRRLVICKPNPEELVSLYAMGCAAPELQTCSTEPFVTWDEFRSMANKETMLAGFIDDKLVGFVHASAAREYGCINYLLVAEEYRGNGYGRDMLEAAIAALRSQGVAHIYSWIHPESRMHNLLRDNGFDDGEIFRYVYRSFGKD